MNMHVRACVQSVHHQHAHMISNGHVSTDDAPVKPKTSLHRAFLQVVDVMDLCFMHALLYNTDISKFRHMMILVHFDEAMIHLMQFSLVISSSNVTFSVF